MASQNKIPEKRIEKYKISQMVSDASCYNERKNYVNDEMRKRYESFNFSYRCKQCIPLMGIGTESKRRPSGSERYSGVYRRRWHFGNARSS